MKKYFKGVLIGAVFIVLNGCGFGDASGEGIINKEDGISVDKVYLSDGKNNLETRTFKYGQKIYTNFEGVGGFSFENDKYYPQMSVYVVSKKGDTVLGQQNLYQDDQGFGKELNLLNSHVILADPISSGNDYTIYYTITDERGDGKFSSEMDFKLVRDDAITVEKNGFDFKEAYLMSQATGEVITDAHAGFGQQLLMDFQGLEGYQLKNGRVELGLAVKVTDASGYVVLDNKDAFANQGLNEDQVKKGVAGTLTLTKGKINNPIIWEVRLWDKNSDAELSAQAEITVED